MSLGCLSHNDGRARVYRRPGERYSDVCVVERYSDACVVEQNKKTQHSCRLASSSETITVFWRRSNGQRSPIVSNLSYSTQ
jgi:hypothetical protein